MYMVDPCGDAGDGERRRVLSDLNDQVVERRGQDVTQGAVGRNPYDGEPHQRYRAGEQQWDRDQNRSR